MTGRVRSPERLPSLQTQGPLVFDVNLASPFVVSPELVEGSNHGRVALRQARFELAGRLRACGFGANRKILPVDQGNRVFHGWSCILLSFVPCQARRPLSRMTSMPMAVGEYNSPDILAGLPRSSDQPGPATNPDQRPTRTSDQPGPATNPDQRPTRTSDQPGPATNPDQRPTRTSDQPGMTGNDRKWQEKRKTTPANRQCRLPRLNPLSC